MSEKRCAWCLGHSEYIQYHDEEWGTPLFDERKTFEFMVLESFQSGLSWLTILRKRDNFRRAFDDFDVSKIAKYGEKDLNRLMNDASIVRNRAKIEATINNARVVEEMHKRGENLVDYFWDFVDHTPIQNKLKNLKDADSKTPLSEKISKQMKKDGFRFLGPTTVYSHMQATGMVNDHLVSCPRYKELNEKYSAK